MHKLFGVIGLRVVHVHEDRRLRHRQEPSVRRELEAPPRADSPLEHRERPRETLSTPQSIKNIVN